MASPTQWTWVWVNSQSWWWTGRPGMLQSMGSQRVRHNWATELNWTPPGGKVQLWWRWGSFTINIPSLFPNTQDIKKKQLPTVWLNGQTYININFKILCIFLDRWYKLANAMIKIKTKIKNRHYYLVELPTNTMVKLIHPLVQNYFI